MVIRQATTRSSREGLFGPQRKESNLLKRRGIVQSGEQTVRPLASSSTVVVESSVSEADNLKSSSYKIDHPTMPNSPTIKQMAPSSPVCVKQVSKASPKTKPLPVETAQSKALMKETIEFCKSFNQFQDRIKVEYKKLLKEMSERDREVRRMSELEEMNRRAKTSPRSSPSSKSPKRDHTKPIER
jgi:hypothetical protein